MLRYSSTDIQRKWGEVQDAALSQPVAISRNDRDRLVIISAQEYARLMRRARRAMSLADFTAEDIAALEAARAPEEAKAFNHEVG